MMIHVLYTKLSFEQPGNWFNEYYFQLPATLRQKNERYRNWEDRARHAAGNVLLMQALRLTGGDPRELHHLKYSPHGRPWLPGKFDFNISHSGHYVICAISSIERVGIDVEEIKPVDFCYFQNVMSAHQWAIIMEADYPVKEFYRFWTLKESIIKADGRGLFIPLHEIDIKRDIGIVNGMQWFLKELVLDEQHLSCLATRNKVCDIDVRKIDLNAL